MDKVPTGIKGLDNMLNGGLPKGRVILICGGPGSGKTIFSLQHLIAAVTRGEPCVYLTLEEPLAFLKQNVESIGWNLEDLEKEGSLRLSEFSINADLPQEKKGYKKNNDLLSDSIIERVRSLVHEVDAKHIVIDPLTSVTIKQQRAGMKRHEIAKIFSKLRRLECTSLLTTECVPAPTDFYMEEFVADGVILLNKVVQNYRLVNILRIEKMRGIAYDDQPRRYIIDKHGLTVYNTEPVMVGS